MEARLKEDILREAEHYGGAIMVIHETNDGQIFDAWEHVNSDAIQTPLEVFKSLEADGFPIKYARVPITDGKAPKSSDFDTLAVNIASASKDTAFVFNCQVKVFLLSCFCFTCMWRCSYTSECFCVCFPPISFLFSSFSFVYLK
jgi:hypothetical protein